MQLGCGPVVNVMEWGSKTNHFAGKVVGISWDIYIYTVYITRLYINLEIYIYIYINSTNLIVGFYMISHKFHIKLI